MNGRQYALACLRRSAHFRELAQDAADSEWRRFWLLRGRAAVAEARAELAFFALTGR